VLIYKLATSTPATPSYSNGATSGATIPNGWSKTPPSLEYSKNIYVSSGVYKNKVYSDWSAPSLYSRYAYDGQDGDSGSIDRDSIYSALGTLYTHPNDGIYNDGNGNIGINASAIRTGILAFKDSYNSDIGWIAPFAHNGYYVNLPGFTIDDFGTARFSGKLGSDSAYADDAWIKSL
jgi:hypothetical protein